MYTNALGLVVVEGPPGVARCTLCSTVDRTTRASLRHAVVAFALVLCKRNQVVGHGVARVRRSHLTDVRIHAVLAGFIVHPALHE